jgi:hypothetical protein
MHKSCLWSWNHNRNSKVSVFVDGLQHSTTYKVQDWGLLTQNFITKKLDKIDPMHITFPSSCEVLLELSPKGMKTCTHKVLSRNSLLQTTLKSNSICKIYDFFKNSWKLIQEIKKIGFEPPEILFPKHLPFCTCVNFIKRSPTSQTTCQ